MLKLLWSHSAQSSLGRLVSTWNLYFPLTSLFTQGLPQPPPVQAHMCVCTSSQENSTGTYLLLKLCHLFHFEQGIISGIMRYCEQEFHAQNCIFLVMILKYQQNSFFSPCSATDFTVIQSSQHSSSPNEWSFKGMRRVSSPLIGWCSGVVQTWSINLI